MGEYMEVSIFKKVETNPFFASKKDILFNKLKDVKSIEEKNLLAKEFSLYDNERNVNYLELLNPFFWTYNNNDYVTYDGIFGLYDIFPPIHQYYKYYMPTGWLALTKAEEFELSKTFGRVVLPMKVIKERLDLLLEEVSIDSDIYSFFLKEVIHSDKVKNVSLYDMIKGSNDNDYVYLSLGRIYDMSEGGERDISKEVEVVQKKRKELSKTYSLEKYYSLI